MKFVTNTNYKAAGTVILDGVVRRLKERGESVIQNDWRNYENFDVAIFMAPDSDVRKAKKNNPKILTIIFDPKVSRARQRAEATAADMLIVSSIEQRDFFLKYNKNVFVYYMFPDVATFSKIHTQKDRISIAYHGNKQHLDAFRDLSVALDEIAKEKNIELVAIYNREKLGMWMKNHPKVCSVKHVQWSETALVENLKDCDIGIAPSLLFAPKCFARPLRSFVYNPESYNKNDYVLRFKMSNNPGRIYVFSQLDIPVVSDFSPSACQIIEDGSSGKLAGNVEGWKAALMELIESAEKRNIYSQNLRERIQKNFSIEKNFERLLDFIKTLHESRQ